MIIFIGAFNPISQKMPSYSSAAGAKVQVEIIDALKTVDEDTIALIMPEVPSWPKGKLFVRPKGYDYLRFLSIVNINFLKRFTFLVQVIYFVLRYRPKSIVYYNSSFISCLFSLLLRGRGTRVLILQDVFVARFDSLSSFFSIRNVLNYLYVKLLPLSFDFYIPITRHCISELKLPEENSEVFPGSVSKQRLLDHINFSTSLSNYSVFAGALEEYNGVDILINNWPSHEEFLFELHIFGGGRLSDFVKKQSKVNLNIIYHGFKAPDIVDEYLKSSRINFCLRYSRGLDQRFFFPSKFFDLILLPGFLVCNDFDNIPTDLIAYFVIVNDDLGNMKETIINCLEGQRDVAGLHQVISDHYTWQGFISEFYKRRFL